MSLWVQLVLSDPDDVGSRMLLSGPNSIPFANQKVMNWAKAREQTKRVNRCEIVDTDKE
jgi:hypothetical protein